MSAHRRALDERKHIVFAPGRILWLFVHLETSKYVQTY